MEEYWKTSLLIEKFRVLSNCAFKKLPESISACVVAGHARAVAAIIEVGAKSDHAVGSYGRSAAARTA